MYPWLKIPDSAYDYMLTLLYVQFLLIIQIALMESLTGYLTLQVKTWNFFPRECCDPKGTQTWGRPLKQPWDNASKNCLEEHQNNAIAYTHSKNTS